MSWLAPPQFGERMSRWLCSVWDSMRVHVCSSRDADDTVVLTVAMLALAFLSDSITPSIASLTVRTLSSSA